VGQSDVEAQPSVILGGTRESNCQLTDASLQQSPVPHNCLPDTVDPAPTLASGTLWRRINRVMRMMLHTQWSAEAWSQVKAEFTKALALSSEIRRAGWFN
jgi:hypothetical protein